MVGQDAGGSAGSRRFWITVLCFALANLALWGVVAYRDRGRRDILRVEEFLPGDKGRVGETRGGQVVFTWKFNLDVKPGAGGGSEVSTAPATLVAASGPATTMAAARPAGGEEYGVVSVGGRGIGGRWAWVDARTLTFAPDEALPRASVVRVSLNGGKVRTAEGYGLARGFEATVETPRLGLAGARQVEFDEQGRFVLELTFDDGVVPADVYAHLKVFLPAGKDKKGAYVGGKEVKVSPFGENQGKVVRVQTEAVNLVQGLGNEGLRTMNLPGGDGKVISHLTVELSEGLAGVSGPLGLEWPVTREVEVSGVLAATGAREYSDYSSNRREKPPAIEVSFNNRVTDGIKEVVSVEPAVEFTVRHESNDAIVLLGDFKPGTRYGIKIKAGPVGAKGYPAPTTLSVMLPDREPGAWFVHDEGYLGAQGNRAVLVKAVNLKEIEVGVAQVYENNVVRWWNSSADAQQARRLGKILASKKYEVGGAANEIKEVRISLDELVGKETLQDGVYDLAVLNVARAGGDSDDSGIRSEVRYRNRRGYVDEWGENMDEALVTVSDIGLAARRTKEGMVAWAVSLSKGTPLPEIGVRVYSNKNQMLGEGKTDADGLVRLTGVVANAGEEAVIVVASSGDGKGLTWLDLGRGAWDGSDFGTSGRAYLRKGFEAYVWTERGVYRPGETVVLRGIVRGKDGVAMAEGTPVMWQILRPDGRKWRSTGVKVDGDGAAEWRVEMPSDVATGGWSATLGLAGGGSEKASADGNGAGVFGRVRYQVEEYMPERLKVKLGLAQGDKKGEQRFKAGGEETITAQVQGDYLFGQPGAGLDTSVVLRMEPATFGHEGWEGWIFGDAADAQAVFGGTRPMARRVESGTEQLDEKGSAEIELSVGDGAEVAVGTEGNAGRLRGKHARRAAARATQQAAMAPAATGPSTQGVKRLWDFHGPWRLVATATVNEVGGRGVTTVASGEADEVEAYVGMKAADGPAVLGKGWEAGVALVSPDGKGVKEGGAIEVKVYRERWNNTLVFEEGRYKYTSTQVMEPMEKLAGKVTLGEDGKGKISLAFGEAGSYVVEAREPRSGVYATQRVYAVDERERGGWEDNISRETPEKLELQWVGEGGGKGKMAEAVGKAGSTAKVLVKSPFAGELLVTVETDEVVYSKVMEIKERVQEVSFEVTEAMRPNAYVTASVVRAVDANAAWRVHRAYGVLAMRVDSGDHRLNVRMEGPKETRPNQTLDMRLVITDDQGKAVGHAAVAVAGVDEGILQLTGYAVPDALAFFSAKRAWGVSVADVYGALMPEVPGAKEAKAPGGDGSGHGDIDAEAEVRHQTAVGAKRVVPVVIVPEVLHADENGVVELHLQVPAFLGNLRVMALAYSGARFGSAGQGVMVKSPVAEQSSFPRFAAPGDEFEVPVTVFNNTGLAGKAKLHVTLEDAVGNARGKNPFVLGDGKLAMDLDGPMIAAGGQGEIMFTVKAGQAVGVGRVHVVTELGDERFIEDVEIPVRPAAPRVTVGNIAVVKADQALAIDLPGDMLAGTGRVDVSVTAQAQLHLPNGLEYLDHYPYGCAEQTISTAFPLVYLSDIGPAIAPGVFDKERTARKVQVGITRLLSMQTADGGVAMWPGGRETWPWASVYAGHFLCEAKGAGFEVPEDLDKRLMKYVRKVLDDSPEGSGDVELQTYACYVLALNGKADQAAMNRLAEVIAGREKNAGVGFPIDETQGRFWLAAGWMAAGRKDRAADMIPQSLPSPRKEREVAGNLGSPVRDRALLLSTLLSVNPEHGAIPGLATKLAETARPGGWDSTQDTAFAVMALGKYMRSIKDQVAFDKAEIMADGGVVGQGGAGGAVWQLEDNGAAKMPKGLRVRIEGKANAVGHVGWTLSGVPTKAELGDHGVKLRRTYFDEAGKALEGREVHSGELIRVELTVDVPESKDNMVVEDLLPAGFEIENTALASGAAVGEASTEGKRAFGKERLEARDDRLVLFGTAPTGKSTYAYYVRAVSVGAFVVPPARCECMYDLGVNSVWGSGTVRVVPAVKNAKVARVGK